MPSVVVVTAHAAAPGRCAVRIWRDPDMGLWGALVGFPTGGGAAIWCESQAEAVAAVDAIIKDCRARQAGAAA